MPRLRKHRVPDDILAKARALRGEITPAEKELWRRLRSGQFGEFKFRRQVAVGRYVVDFVCASAKLAVEIDGDTHDGREEYDAERTREPEKEWYRVIRFTNGDVHRNIDAVLEEILNACREARRIHPSP